MNPSPDPGRGPARRRRADLAVVQVGARLVVAASVPPGCRRRLEALAHLADHLLGGRRRRVLLDRGDHRPLLRTAQAAAPRLEGLQVEDVREVVDRLVKRHRQ